MSPARRAFFALAAFSATIGVAHAANPTMFRDAGCGCCLKWLEQVKASFGQKAVVVNSPDMDGIKDKHGVPQALRSCHTVLVGGKILLRDRTPVHVDQDAVLDAAQREAERMIDRLDLRYALETPRMFWRHSRDLDVLD